MSERLKFRSSLQNGSNSMRDIFKLFKSSIALLNNDRKRLITKFGLLQASLALIDLVAVALFGILGSLAVSGIQSTSPSSVIENALKVLMISDLRFQSQVAFIALLASSLLALRTILSMILSRRLLFELAEWSADFSVSLFGNLMRGSIVEVRKSSELQIIQNITAGVNTLTMTVLGGGINFIGDFTIVLFVLTGILLIDPLMGVSVLILFSILLIILYLNLHQKAEILGRNETKKIVVTNQSLFQAIESFREVYVRNRIEHFVSIFELNRRSLTKTQAEVAFLPNISKYVFELAMVVGALFIGAIQFGFHDATTAVGSLTLFFAASSRIAPALLRLQQSFLGLNSAKGYSSETLSLLQLSATETIDTKLVLAAAPHQSKRGFISIRDLVFKFVDAEARILDTINLDFPTNGMFAIVGSSGAGKTTLVDLILGILSPTSGEILIDGQLPRDYILLRDGKVGYVPQEIHLFPGSIRENIMLGFVDSEISDDQIYRALVSAQLYEFVERLENGMNTRVGPGGITLSGGQRQKLGIARALVTDPNFLVLDEPTSALDAESEDAIIRVVRELTLGKLVIVIAHRLSSIRQADSIVFLDAGKIAAQGNFENLYQTNMSFKTQVDLLSV